MATDNKKADAQGDGAPEPVPGIPDPNPTVPDASTEPVAQAVAATSETPETVAPPIPADYEMPDDYATQDPIATAKEWVEAHPGLAILGAAGVGLIAGRLITSLFPDPEPPSLSDRVEKRARQLQKEARKRGQVYSKEAAAIASSAGGSLQDSLHRAAEALRDAASQAASQAGGYAGEGYEKTKDLAETFADAAREAITGVLAGKVDDWVKKVRD